MTAHLGYTKNEKAALRRANARNGTSSKVIKTSEGEVPIDIPRDRTASFEPVTIPKHSRMSQQLEDVILQLYAKGMSTQDISDDLSEDPYFEVVNNVRLANSDGLSLGTSQVYHYFQLVGGDYFIDENASTFGTAIVDISSY